MPERDDALSEPDSTSLLSWHARELYNDLRMVPMLRQLMMTSCRLTGSLGGSVSLVDPVAGRYTKVAERGTACRLGESFPLRQGITGQVVSRRAPVVLASYRQIASGHLPVGHPAANGAVVGIPIWWRGEVFGVNVVFAGTTRPFTVEEVDRLELVTQVVAPGVVTAVERELPAARVVGGPDGEAGGGAPGILGGTGAGALAQDLLNLIHRTAAAEDRVRPDRVQLTVLASGERARLLVRDDAGGTGGDGLVPAPWREVVDVEGGAVAVRPADDWDEAVTRRPPTGSAAELPDRPSSPLSVRERQVATLLTRGMSDRAVAEALCISPKTVEKHVSAVLRKTGTTSRTAAVVRCLERRWVDPEPAPHR